MTTKLPELIADPINDIGLFWGAGAPPSDFLPGISSGWRNSATGDVYTLNDSLEWKLLGLSGSVAWDDITGKPTTVAASGLTDALTQDDADDLYQPIGSYLTTTDAADTYLPLAGGTLTDNLVFSDDATERFIKSSANGGAIRLRGNSTTGSDRGLWLGIVDNSGEWTQNLGVTFGAVNIYEPLTVSGDVSLSDSIYFTAASTTYSNTNASIQQTTVYGLLLQGVTGSSFDFALASAGGTNIMLVPTGTGATQFYDTMQIRGNSRTPADGAGIELYGSSAPKLLAYNRGSSAFLDMIYDANKHTFSYHNTPKLTIISDRATFANDTYTGGRFYQTAGGTTDAPYAVPTMTVSEDPPPSSAAGYPDGHEWNQVTMPT